MNGRKSRINASNNSQHAVLCGGTTIETNMEKLENTLDDEDPMWLINAQIICLMAGYGATEDHEAVLCFLTEKTGLPKVTVEHIHRAICCAFDIGGLKIKTHEI